MKYSTNLEKYVPSFLFVYVYEYILTFDCKNIQIYSSN